MKAIGGMAISHAATITPGMIWGSGIFTGLFWLLMGVTGAITWIEKVTTKPVVRGIMLGLGLSFIVEGLGMMRAQPLLAIGGAVLTLLLFNNQTVSSDAGSLGIRDCDGFCFQAGVDPSVLSSFHSFSVARDHSRKDLMEGASCRIRRFGTSPSSLTLGNAIIGTVAENNSHFPDRKVTAKTISIDHGVMNLVSATIGGIPLCHGAGGMAGHIRFGARTGGALVILGVIVLLTGLFLSDSVTLLLSGLSSSYLGSHPLLCRG